MKTDIMLCVWRLLSKALSDQGKHNMIIGLFKIYHSIRKRLQINKKKKIPPWPLTFPVQMKVCGCYQSDKYNIELLYSLHTAVISTRRNANNMRNENAHKSTCFSAGWFTVVSVALKAVRSSEMKVSLEQ